MRNVAHSFKSRDYLPAPKHTMTLMHKGFEGYHTAILKVPINQIKRPNSYPNELDEREAFRILMEFDRERWDPVYIDPEYNLLDGQHKLWVAKQMGYHFIDAIMVREPLN